jgi:hypothetical protein
MANSSFAVLVAVAVFMMTPHERRSMASFGNPLPWSVQR